MKSAGVSEYFVDIILHACKKNKRACVFKHNGTKEHTKQMDIINMILARPNILIKDPVHEFKFDNLVGNAESPSDVILVQVINITCPSNQQHSTPPILYGWQRCSLAQNSSSTVEMVETTFSFKF